MKILLLTDSLGAPRSDIEVEKTWTYRFIEKYSKDNVIYTSLTRGLSSSYISMDFVKDFKPDIIICQIGIVDATRRAINQKLLKVIKLIPGLRSVVHRILHRFHYRFTKMFNIHIAPPNRFKNNMSNLNGIANEYLVIPIAPASSEMKKKVYNMESDIQEYNRLIDDVFGKQAVLKAYDEVINADDIFLSDGHHLNEKGHDIVFSSIEKYMESR